MHVIARMTEMGPASEHICADEIAQPLGWLDCDGVFIKIERAVPDFQLAPQAVEMNGVAPHTPHVSF